MSTDNLSKKNFQPTSQLPSRSDLTHALEELCSEHGVRSFYAIESGSRAWGFASPDSDFDVRFLYCHPRRCYTGVDATEESIVPPVNGLLDFEGWDVRKAARLLLRSNGALLEWLHSPIVYAEEDDVLGQWRKLAARCFSRYDLVNHYRGLLMGMWKSKLNGNIVRPKDYLYALRSASCARWVVKRDKIPPVDFQRSRAALPTALQSDIDALLAIKSTSSEGHQIDRIASLDNFFDQTTRELPRQIETLEKRAFPKEDVNALIQQSLRHPDSTRIAHFNLDLARKTSHLLLDVTAGSHAFGTNVPESDIDRKGIFCVPNTALFGLNHIFQVSDELNDEVYYELGRFVDLLLKNNPTAFEILGSPADCIHYKHPVLDLLQPADFLSKLCAKSFGGYAMAQVKKARGLNKKIVNPQPEQRYPLAHFCNILEEQGTKSLKDWLKKHELHAANCGLTAVKGAANTYAIFIEPSANNRGIFSSKDPDRLIFSSVAKEAKPVAWMHCNIDAFRAHCKAHREYWKWVETRNESRYATNAKHDRGYDSKNMMHTMRLLDMAYEIATEGRIIVRRPNAAELLKIRAGEYSYEYLLAHANERLEQVEQAFAASQLPDAPNHSKANQILIEMRELRS